MRKDKTYMDKLMEDKKFLKRFDEEYQNLCIGEQIASARHQAHLTQAALSKRKHTTKSAISSYESADHNSYNLTLLKRIAEACGANLNILFVEKRTRNNSRSAHNPVFDLSYQLRKPYQTTTQQRKATHNANLSSF